jgi:SAM-dependent methyltransferase
MRALLLIFLASCAAHAAPTPTCPPPAPPPAPPPVAPPPQAPKLDDQAVIKMSHDFFGALDRFDIAAATPQFGPTFAYYSEARFSDKDALVAAMQNQLDHHAAPRSRSWADDHVFVGGDVAIWVGYSVRHVPAENGGVAHDEEAYTTLVWVPDGAAWKVAHAAWDRRGLDAERERWNDWLSTGSGFTHEPNKLLVDTVKGRKPGTALDIATGQGRNAIALAALGWKVTGVDISDAGLRLAQEEAARRKLKLATVESDIATYDLGANKWDLVTMIYAGADLDLVARVKSSVRKGGLFVTEYFAADSDIAKGGAGGWDKAALEAAFADGWTIVKSEEVEDNADWAGQRKTKLVRFVAQKR